MLYKDLKVLDNFKIISMGENSPILKKMNNGTRVDENNAMLIGSNRWYKVALNEKVELVTK